MAKLDVVSNSFTFLATLLLLLAVSCAIVARSVIIRRRFRRRVAEALAAGIVLPPEPGPFGGIRRQRDFGEKPKLWDAWIVPDPGEENWGAVMVRLAFLLRVMAFVADCRNACVCSPCRRRSFPTSLRARARRARA